MFQELAHGSEKAELSEANPACGNHFPLDRLIDEVVIEGHGDTRPEAARSDAAVVFNVIHYGAEGQHNRFLVKRFAHALAEIHQQVEVLGILDRFHARKRFDDYRLIPEVMALVALENAVMRL